MLLLLLLLLLIVMEYPQPENEVLPKGRNPSIDMQQEEGFQKRTGANRERKEE